VVVFRLRGSGARSILNLSINVEENNWDPLIWHYPPFIFPIIQGIIILRIGGVLLENA
jgi:hypothetical protein